MAYLKRDDEALRQESAEIITRVMRLHAYRAYRGRVRGAITILGAFFILRIKIWRSRRKHRCGGEREERIDVTSFSHTLSQVRRPRRGLSEEAKNGERSDRRHLQARGQGGAAQAGATSPDRRSPLKDSSTFRSLTPTRAQYKNNVKLLQAAWRAKQKFIQGQVRAICRQWELWQDRRMEEEVTRVWEERFNETKLVRRTPRERGERETGPGSERATGPTTDERQQPTRARSANS
jgi:hypothetical protein